MDFIRDRHGLSFAESLAVERVLFYLPLLPSHSPTFCIARKALMTRGLNNIPLRVAGGSYVI